MNLGIMAKSVCMSVLALFVFVFGQTAGAQEMTLDAPTSVYVGQTFRVTYTFKGNYSDFKPPVWGNAFTIQGPFEQNSFNISMINGQVSRIESHSQAYMCRISAPGVYEIPSASATVNGKIVKTEPQKIEVLAAGAQNARVPQSGNANQGRTNTQNGSSNDASDLLVVAQLSQNEVYQGQPVVLTFKIYSRVTLLNLEDLQFPDLKGFWAKEMDAPKQVPIKVETYNGKEYNAGIIRQYVLYPQKSGELQIDPIKVTALCRVRGEQESFFDSFMGIYSTQERTVLSSPRKLKVNALPAGAPNSFKGAVGKFDLEAQIDKTTPKTNEPISYTLTISGTGNMQLLQKPEPSFPSTVEVFPPKLTENYALRNGAQTGSVSYEYTLIPRVPGKISLPAFEFSYFDPKAHAYKTLQGKAFELDVEADSTQTFTTVSGAVSKEDVQYLGQDIRHIYIGSVVFKPLHEAFVGSILWWVLLALIIALFIVLWFFLRRRQAYLADLVLVRGRRAGGVARKRLKRAKSFMDVDAAQFYIELERAIWGYFSDKLAIELSELSSDGLQIALREQQVPDETIAKLQGVIAQCEYARYAPSSVQDSQEQIYANTLDVFEALERWLKGHTRKK